ncbi:glycosyl hydrolase family 18 protein [Priestia aryabhattai]|uniref:glycosyl hydrolase family 18 protein n=1 Tax=Priestia aryabhattai TaxID=412384 RepID=UPI0023B0D008|nr:glycosyl hydrolase family 18 protein [Priestia aryabhattai]MDE8674602.1 glycosyl hydrolase family 18 protein [Priestia aryabhattai]
MEHKTLIMGYWHNWSEECSGGYLGGTFSEVDLIDVPKEYNVIVVAYMKGSGIPTFKPVEKPSKSVETLDKEFREQVDQLILEGRQVLFSLGGPDSCIELQAGQEEQLAKEIIRLVEIYGFSGICLDLEQNAIEACDNQQVIPAALKVVKDYYKNEGKHFLIALAPEFPYLSTLSGKYFPYLISLEGYYDLVCPQLYNQGGDGVWVEELDAWLVQNSDDSKGDFLYYIMDSLINGTREYTPISHNKLVMGLPTNEDAANTGYVMDPSAVFNAMERLRQNGSPIRGLSAWSINWDCGRNRNNIPYSYEFINRYKGIITSV